MMKGILFAKIIDSFALINSQQKNKNKLNTTNIVNGNATTHF